MQQRTRIHAQTLSELNHCVGTARRDAAFNCLLKLVMSQDWPTDREERAERIAKCLFIVNEVLDTTRHSSLMFSDPHQALYDKPLLHFLRLLVQLFQSMDLLGDHIRNVMNESDVLSEHLGKLLRHLQPGSDALSARKNDRYVHTHAPSDQT